MRLLPAIGRQTFEQTGTFGRARDPPVRHERFPQVQMHSSFQQIMNPTSGISRPRVGFATGRIPSLHLAALCVVLLAPLAGAASRNFGVTNSQLPRVADSRLDSALARTWRGLIRNNIDPWTDGLLHRPNSETPGDAVSEGQAYGMIVALYAGDQATFDKIWDASEKHLWNATEGYYDWRWKDGAITSKGMATDADQDIALMLLFADSLVKKGMWSAHKSPKNVDYRTRAMDLLKTIWTTAVSPKYNLAPGAGWGGDNFVNPGYLSPASYRVFAKVDSTRNWMAVVNQCYAVLSKNPGAGKGLVPDWMVPDGTYYNGDLGYNPYRAGKALYKDAIRVHWRLAMDWLWFGEPRAKAFLDSAAAFVGTPDRANFYSMDGTPVPLDDTFSLGDKQWRSRQEYSELTLGMWACAAFSSKGADSVSAWVDSLLAFLPSGATTWGRAADKDIPGRNGSEPNEQYFDEFLAWFGAAVLAGRFSNILDDLDDPNPTISLDWVTLPPYGPVSIDFQVAPFTLSAKLNKAASWTVSIQSYPDGPMWSTAGRSEGIDISWNGYDLDGKPFPQGWCFVKVKAGSLPTQVGWAWLSHHRDIRASSDWIVVDDFSASTLSPNLGSWGTFDNSSNGGSAKVGPLAPSGSGSDRSLTYTYDLGENGYQYCGLEWDAKGWTGLANSTKIRYRAKADHRTVMDLYMVQSDIPDHNYFHVLDTLTTSWKTYEHDYSQFRGRLGSRTDNLNPAKGTALHWHIQADKCLDSKNCVKGTVSIDDIHLGGEVSEMIAPPADALAMPPNPPIVEARKRVAARGGLLVKRLRRGLVELGAEAGTTVRWVAPDGRLLGTSGADENGTIRWNPPPGLTGIVFAAPVRGTGGIAVVLR